MARYNEIEASFWDDPDLQDRPALQKLLYIYLFSNALCRPSGLYRISFKTMEFHLGLGRGFVGAWKGLQGGLKPLIMYDADLNLVWVIGKLKRYIKSLDESNPIKKSVDHDISEFLKSPLIPYFLKKYEGAYKPLPGVHIPITTPIPLTIPKKEEGVGEEKKSDKTKFLEFVELKDEELKKLIDKLGEKNTQIWIERLNNYIGSKGKKYLSHYHTILTWHNRNPLPPARVGAVKIDMPVIPPAEREALSKQIHEFTVALKTGKGGA